MKILKDRFFVGVMAAALIAVLAFPVFTLVYIYPTFSDLLIRHEADEAYQTARQLILWLGNRNHDFESRTMPEAFIRHLDHSGHFRDLLKAKIIALDGTVLFSTDESEIGSRVEHSNFRKVIETRKVHTRVLKREEKTSDGETSKQDVVETYVPIIEDGRIRGAFELYADVTLQTTRLAGLIWQTSFLLFLLVSLLLCGLIYAAYRGWHSILARNDAEDRLRQISRDWEDTFNTITDMITVHDMKFNIVRANRAAEKMLGASGSMLTASKCFQRIHGTECPPEDCPSCESIQTGKPAHFETYEPHLGKNIEFRSIPRFDDGGNIVGLIHIARDITERKNMEDRLREMSITDELTGLLNRRGFFKMAEQQLEVSRRTGGELSLYYADLDNMKEINDRFGHEAGDLALKDTAQLFRDVFRKSDILARMGGDEFVAMMVEDSRYNAARRLRVQLNAFNEIGERSWKLNLSVGTVRYHPDGPMDIDSLLKEADFRMYEDKNRKKPAGLMEGELEEDGSMPASHFRSEDRKKGKDGDQPAEDRKHGDGNKQGA